MNYSYVVKNNKGKFIKLIFHEDRDFEFELTDDINEAFAYEYLDDIEMDFEHYQEELNEELKPCTIAKIDENLMIVASTAYEFMYTSHLKNDF